METEKAVSMILLGGLLGIVGQGVRMIVGLKKLNEENSQKKPGESIEKFHASRIWLSMFVGFTAGVLALIVKGIDEKFVYTKELAFAIIGAGYSGADFIEGLFNSYIKKDTDEKVQLPAQAVNPPVSPEVPPVAPVPPVNPPAEPIN
ncbi:MULTISPECIES: hypothetical protein [unclassified Chryseobacterium]|uniref:hypothetical protein n=1 Tax=unclassified Chryseobacterium TaxID=2593645 RepID=UPI000D38128D|nr:MULTISPECIES: hypothetical protein [unclassified Chryseobacterium]PTT72588.1 hypothetical protein DBR25_14295 [Chryseobacterium sp. HMWF001]PVV50409.1 hypothetical protein DD829_22355 [Chryseobacterium sp. HMWF035]